jgi:hypothetical protein
LSAAGIGGGLTINLMQGTNSGLDLKGERRRADLMRFLVADFIPNNRST